MLHRRSPRRAGAAALGGLVVTVLSCLSWAPGPAGAADRPDFQLPFPCGQTWRLDTWAHAPALDMVREPDQEGTEGNPLLAPADGEVVESFRHDNAGNVIQIDHGGGWFTTYLHLESRSVDTGDQVGQGDEIGRVGRTGPTANNHPHLHFELAVDEDGDGSATWGFAGSERVRPWFDGVEYGQSNSDTWRDVESNNCGEAPEPTTTAAPTTAPPTTAPPTTAPPTTATPTTTSVPETTTVPPTTAPPTTSAPAPTTTTTRDIGDTLPATGTSTTAVAAAAGAALLAAGTALVLVRRRLTR
jgi:LPXTG-motif cell wall-anchored protein